MKVRDVFLDCATVVGSCVGVGFISGKEAKMYLGNYGNVAVFALVFFALCFWVRRFCSRNGCCNTVRLFQSCFGKFHSLFSALFCCCCIICMSTLFAGADSCLQSLLYSVNFPCYSFVAAIVAAFVLKKGMRTLKIMNAVSLTLTFCYLLLAFVFWGGCQTERTTGMPVLYALFSVTTSLGVLAPLSKRSVKRNLVLSAVSAVTFGLLFVLAVYLSDFSLQMPIIGRTDSKFFNMLAASAVLVSVVCGVTANAIPVFQCISDVFHDDAFCAVMLFAITWAFSLFGFDFALKFGYVAVALFGVSVVAATFCATKRCRCFKLSCGSEKVVCK